MTTRRNGFANWFDDGAALICRLCQQVFLWADFLNPVIVWQPNSAIWGLSYAYLSQSLNPGGNNALHLCSKFCFPGQ